MPLVFEKLKHLTETLRSMIYRDPLPLRGWQIIDGLPADAPPPPLDDPGWRALQPGELWGGRLSWAWLRATANVPDHMSQMPVATHLDLDALLDNPDGKLFSPPEAMVTVTASNTPADRLPPLQAINVIHHEIWITEQATAGQEYDLTLHVFCGVSQPGDHRVRLKIADLVSIDRDIEGLYWDARVLLDTFAILPESAPERGFCLRALDDAFQHINWLNPPDDTFRQGVRDARTHVHERIFDIANHSPDLIPRPVIHALGHAHIDVAWLWPLAVSRGKAARTFATALALMDRYPDYTFTQSQPHLYKMVAEDRPELFTRIKERITEGRWNATGGTWVEMDTNLSGGESLVRQFLYGMRYFQRELGVRPRVLWLPDVFGYSAALPQIMQLAEVPFFFTSKLSWNTYTRYPYDTFWWEGLDGSRVLTHLATTPEQMPGISRATYNAVLTPKDVSETWEHYQQKDANHHLAVAYGLGDGGGGPNHDMIERRARMADLPGLPQVQHGTAEAFFHALEKTVPDNLPRWVGELYLQFHRGTYTSQARTKRHNRKLEALLHDAEALSVTAHLLKTAYPHETLNAAWETLLLNQFHDILPGSSITPVYDDAERDYTDAEARAAAVRDKALETIAAHVRYDEDMHGFVVFNTLSTMQGGLVEVVLPGSGPVEIVGPSGRSKPFQWTDRDARRALVIPNTVPAYGHKAYAVRPAERDNLTPIGRTVSGTANRLENEFLRAEFDARGNLIRLYDLENFRDVFEPGTTGNQLWAYVDRPHVWDAWEVEAYVQDQGWQLEPESVRVLEPGPLRATLEITYTFNRSRIVQRVSLLTGQRMLVFDTDVDWHERHILLRTHFPLAIRAMNTTYEIQFGTVERPTHRNTAWDQARHEVPAQQWADMSEGGYGVSLLNDCKYGYSTQGNVLTLSLLRAPTHPDPEADQGNHTFTYALYPHAGDWRNDVITHAKRLNNPLLVRPVTGGGTWLPVVFGLVTHHSPGIVIDTIKKAEDDDSLIMRVYEAHGGRDTSSVRFAAPIESAEEVNLLEEPIGPISVLTDTLRFQLTPYQIRSFRVTLSDIIEHQLG